jgi:hypothetical protein
MIPSLIWAAVVVYLVERLLPLVRPLFEAKHPKPSQQVAIPGALLALANRESEDWAREQVMQAIREAYDDTQDWNMVSVRMGLGG